MKPNIGIDTIRFHKRYDAESVARIQDGLRSNRDGQLMFHGMRAWRVPKTMDGYSFELSVPKLLTENRSNLFAAAPDGITALIHIFQSRFGLNIFDAKLSRIDLAFTYETGRPVDEYFKRVKSHGKCRKTAFPHGFVIRSSQEHELAAYDKYLELVDHGHADALTITDQNIMRIEWRLSRHIAKLLRLPEGSPVPTVGGLVENSLYFGLIDAFEREAIRMYGLCSFRKEENRIGLRDMRIISACDQRSGYSCNLQRLAIVEEVGMNHHVPPAELAVTLAAIKEKITRMMSREVYQAIRVVCEEEKAKYPPNLAPAQDVREVRSLLANRAPTQAADAPAVRPFSVGIVLTWAELRREMSGRDRS